MQQDKNMVLKKKDLNIRNGEFYSVADETDGEEFIALVTVALVSLSGFLQLSWINYKSK
jgi:hypothetical protein